MVKPLKDTKELITRPARAEVSAEEALMKMKEFPARKEKLVATIRKGTN